MRVRWRGATEGASQNDIARVEKKWGIGFPKAYARIAKAHAGDRFHLSTDVSFEADSKRPLDGLLSFQPGANQIDGVHAREGLPQSLYPFARDATGNPVCFDYSLGAEYEPRIVFWLLTSAEGYTLADSFDEFWRGLIVEPNPYYTGE